MVSMSADDGDLFPRGFAPEAQPRIKKRNGEVFFGPESKRSRNFREPEIIAPSSDAPDVKSGSALSFSRISPGMTCLGLVVRANSTTINIVLPSGIKAKAIDETLVEDEKLSDTRGPAFNSSGSKANVFLSDDDGSESTASDVSDDEENDGDAVADCASDSEIQPLWRVLSAGNIFPVSIISVEKRGEARLVTVSLKPHLVNVGLNAACLLKKGFSAYAAVLSVEDHGYILSFGSNMPYKAFLPFDKCGDSDAEKPSLQPGTPIEVVTEKDIQVSSKSRGSKSVSILVSACRSKVHSMPFEAIQSASFRDLRAGMLLSARVLKEGPGGLHLLASGVFPLSVDSLHVPRSGHGGNAAKVDDHVVARLLYVDPIRKSIGASLLTSLVRDMAAPKLPTTWETGTLLKPLEVRAVRPDYGLILRISSQKSDAETSLKDDTVMEGIVTENQNKADMKFLSEVSIFAHVSRLFDLEAKQLDSSYFKEGTIFQKGGRIVSISHLDGVVNVDMRPSVLSRKALTIDEVKPGSIYDCKVLSFQRSGLLKVAVDGDSRLDGTIQPEDISDTSISIENLPKHESFRVGATVRCLVLFVNIGSKSIYLTARKSLLNPRYPVLLSLEQAAAHICSAERDSEPQSSSIFTGNVIHPTVHGGLLIRFCNRIVGVIPRSELSLDSNNLESNLDLKAIKAMYPAGQTVYVRVTRVDPNGQRLFLSMNLCSKNDSLTGAVKIGEFVNGTIVGADGDAGHFIVSVKVPKRNLDISSDFKKGRKAEKEKSRSHHCVDCYLPFGHVSDIPAVSEYISVQLSKLINSQSKKSKNQALRVHSALVLTTQHETPLLTLKVSLKNAASNGNLPSTYEGVKKAKNEESSDKRSVLRGYIKALLPTGAIVGFLGDAVGFIPKSKLADRVVRDPAKFLSINQSIAAVVASLDDQKSRFSLSCRPSDVGVYPLNIDSLSAFRSFKSWRELFGVVAPQNLSTGCKVKATVQSVHTYGVQYSLNGLSENITGVVFNGSENTSEVLDEVGTPSNNSKHRRSQQQTKNQLQNDDESPSIGDVHDVIVLDKDPITGVVDLSRDGELLSGVLTKSKLVNGYVFDARVLLVKSMYVILFVKRSERKYMIAHALRLYSNDPLMLLPGSIVKCQILGESPCDDRFIASIDRKMFQGASKKEVRSKGSTFDNTEKKTISLIRRCKEEDPTAILGLEVFGKVFRCNPPQACVNIAQGIVGNLHICNTAHATIEDLESSCLGVVSDELNKKFSLPKVGKTVGPLYIVGICTHGLTSDSAPIVVELTASKAHVKQIGLVKGQKIVGFVKRLSSRFAPPEQSKTSTRVSSRTLISANSSTLVSCSDVDSLSTRNEKLVEGALVVCLIISGAKNGKMAQGCLSENGRNKNDFFLGIKVSSRPGFGIRVLIPWFSRVDEPKAEHWGTVGMCDMDNDFDMGVKLLSSQNVGDVVRVRRIRTINSTDSGEEPNFVLSMRESGETNPKDILLTKENFSGLKKGSKLRGFVKAIGKRGCFVTIGRGIVARIELRNLSDTFIRYPEKTFPVGTLVSGKVDEVTASDGQVHVSMTLRETSSSQLLKPESEIDLKEGVVVNGSVRSIKKFGALVELPNGIVSILHVSEADQDRYVQDSYHEWRIGQKLCVVVIGVKGRKVRVGTKRCYFEAAGKTEEEIDIILEQNETEKNLSISDKNNTTNNLVQSIKSVDRDDEQDEEEDKSARFAISISDEDDVSDDNESSDEMMDVEAEIENVVKSDSPLKVNHKFKFDSVDQETASEMFIDQDSANTIQNTTDELHSKRTSRDKREKKRQKDMKETETRIREEALARNADNPETAEDFERMLMGEPNSSELWIRFMAFCLQLSQVEKARSVAERALETIVLEKESDRLNVWVAYINLEAQFGNMNAKDVGAGDSFDVKRDAAVFRVFDRGCERVTDVKGFHLQVANALEKANPSLSDEILRRAVRKFKSSKEVWIAMGQTFFTRGNLKEARRCLDRALISLEKQDHIAVIAKYAQFEYKFGSVERGSTVFESLVGNYPKRIDLWNIYLDMEIGQLKKISQQENGEYAQGVSKIRRLYERFSSLDLSSKKMKYSFKKWLDFEKTYGSKDDQKAVKSRAREYVDKMQ